MSRIPRKERSSTARRGRGDGGEGSDCFGQDVLERRALRSKYLAVKNFIHDKKEDIFKNDSDNFNSIISEVETLHQQVQKPREQVADAEALLDIANTLVTSVKQQSNAGVTPSDFISFLLKKFGRQNGDRTVMGWQDLGMAVSHVFKKASGCCTMLGPMDMEVKQRKTTVRSRRPKATEIARPKEVCDNGEEKTDTDQNMCTMFNILKRKKCVRLENMVLNRDDFAQTVENIFALSFLIKDGRVQISVNDQGHHLLSPKNAASASAVASREVAYSHFVFRFGVSDWQLMKTCVVAGEELMPNRTYVVEPNGGSQPGHSSAEPELEEDWEDIEVANGPPTPIRKLTRNRGLVLQEPMEEIELKPRIGTDDWRKKRRLFP